MMLLLYLIFLVLGIWLGYFFKVFFTGPDLSCRGVFFCFIFNSFLGALHSGLVLREKLFFIGDVSSWVDEYPLVLWPALIGAFAPAMLMPKKTTRS
ncbi:hypothetical protein [Pseudomonas arcuscaelestis]|uniref:hypothetical protein n=1 Tax=Pseudomonas arcuscaelestis TaxID=2710591 RepID=UPI00193D7839|nr:hypothetical protein [Pseudomonas arcuscaelestis]MBM3114182.1 hypothetical protein [Pseudomonas arcuscaelestis]